MITLREFCVILWGEYHQI